MATIAARRAEPSLQTVGLTCLALVLATAVLWVTSETTWVDWAAPTGIAVLLGAVMLLVTGRATAGAIAVTLLAVTMVVFAGDVVVSLLVGTGEQTSAQAVGLPVLRVTVLGVGTAYLLLGARRGRVWAGSIIGLVVVLALGALTVVGDQALVTGRGAVLQAGLVAVGVAVLFEVTTRVTASFAAAEAAAGARQRLAYVDPLTQVPNRPSIERRLDQALNGRHGPACVALVDVDGIRAINETHGHDRGDQVLRGVASTLVRTTNEADVVGRWNGDEFIVLFYGDRSEAEGVAERCRTNVGQLPGGLPVSISIGLTCAEPDEDRWDVVSRAASLLDRAKGEGRDRVVAG